jgi:hypothetical protein
MCLFDAFTKPEVLRSAGNEENKPDILYLRTRP